MSAVERTSEALDADLSSLSCEHFLHIFPSLGVGGVPLRMVRIINHFGARFRHTVIALDNNFEAAAGIDRSVDVTLWPAQPPRRGDASYRGRRRARFAPSPTGSRTHLQLGSNRMGNGVSAVAHSASYSF
jgi:hypothetical protein